MTCATIRPVFAASSDPNLLPPSCPPSLRFSPWTNLVPPLHRPSQGASMAARAGRRRAVPQIWNTRPHCSRSWRLSGPLASMLRWSARPGRRCRRGCNVATWRMRRWWILGRPRSLGRRQLLGVLGPPFLRVRAARRWRLAVGEALASVLVLLVAWAAAGVRAAVGRRLVLDLALLAFPPRPGARPHRRWARPRRRRAVGFFLHLLLSPKVSFPPAAPLRSLGVVPL